MAGNWRKSSRSNPNGGNCVEVRLDSGWRKSTRSSNSDPNCVEVRLSGPVELRDSKAPELGTLAMSRTEFAALLTRLGD